MPTTCSGSTHAFRQQQPVAVDRREDAERASHNAARVRSAMRAVTGVKNNEMVRCRAFYEPIGYPRDTMPALSKRP